MSEPDVKEEVRRLFREIFPDGDDAIIWSLLGPRRTPAGLLLIGRGSQGITTFMRLVCMATDGRLCPSSAMAGTAPVVIADNYRESRPIKWGRVPWSDLLGGFCIAKNGRIELASDTPLYIVGTNYDPETPVPGVIYYRMRSPRFPRRHDVWEHNLRPALVAALRELVAELPDADESSAAMWKGETPSAALTARRLRGVADRLAALFLERRLPWDVVRNIERRLLRLEGFWL